MASRVIICAAGGGKTTRIVEELLAEPGARAALLTYTQNNEREIAAKFYRRGAVIPAHIEVQTWFTFLLRELARPYQHALHDERIEGLHWVEGRSALYVPESRTADHYFHDGRLIYPDKIAKFVCACDHRSGGAVMRRLAQRFDHILIDEVQDLAGYDLDILEAMLKAGIRLTLVGDHRQATYATNKAPKNSKFQGYGILDKFKAWDKKGLVKLTYDTHTHRCPQVIASLGDSFYPDCPPTVSKNQQVTGHDGVFVVRTADIGTYAATYRPQALRYDRKTKCGDLPAMNFGEVKGMTFDRVLIFPHGGAKTWLGSKELKPIEKSLAKMYVAATRARHSLAFVFDGQPAIADAVIYQPG